MRVLRLAAAAALAATLAACGTGTGTDSAPATSSAPVVELWNPCSLPAEAVAAAGLDPASRESGIGGVEQSGWRICSWDGRAYSITVYSTGRSVADFETKPGNTDFRDVTVAGRTGRQFRVQNGATDLKCDYVFPARQGVLQVALLASAVIDHPADPCVSLRRAADAIVPALPQ
jgi:hypothetical protein